MIIRSQNKKAIVNLNMIDTIEERDNQIRYFSGGGMETVGLLGQYSTEEKAIKVLDMIQNAYCRMKSCDVSMCGIAVAISKQSDDIANRFIEESRNIHVFQMPQDCEV